VNLCQEGIEQVHRVHRRILFRVQRENRVTEDSGELFQVGIELVHRVHRRTLFEFRGKRSVKERHSQSY
jgi:hypothetical protein